MSDEPKSREQQYEDDFYNGGNFHDKVISGLATVIESQKTVRLNQEKQDELLREHTIMLTRHESFISGMTRGLWTTLAGLGGLVGIYIKRHWRAY